MKFTIGWLKEHLDTKSTDSEIIEKLTDVGLEVESFEKISTDLDNFKVAKIINVEQHPNADKLKVCDVDIGQKNTSKPLDFLAMKSNIDNDENKKIKIFFAGNTAIFMILEAIEITMNDLGEPWSVKFIPKHEF